MDNKTLRLLEFDKIKDMLEGYASSAMGKELVRNLLPYTDKAKIEYQLKATDEARDLQTIERFVLPGLKDSRRAIRRGKIGSNLDVEDLLHVYDTLRCARQSKSFLSKRTKKYPLVSGLGSGLIELNELENEIATCIDPEGTIKDSASTKLRSIRAQLGRLRGRIRQRIESMVRSPNLQKYLQESIITVRNDRYVLPVKAEYRSQIQGLIHDQSASGATLYIEPMAIVELNNTLRQLESEETAEIERILRQLSAMVHENVDSLEQNANTLSVLDFLLAKGKYSADLDAVAPRVNENGYIRLRKARHPLLKREEVVPIDVELGRDFSLLVITGPNTGGKTVTLKTIGLLHVMAQAGLHIPADINSEVNVFEDVLADIGDEQSIEQSLSTFSSHMTNIVRILKKASECTLVLFDELGAGTDPTEGAALAMSILDELCSRGCLVTATTHYSELKSYAYNREGIINASMEFNVDTLRPTYRLSIGLPGRSNAFLISQRLGLDAQVIDGARRYVSSDVQHVEDMIIELEENRRKAEMDSIEAERLRREAERLQAEYERKCREIETKERETRKAALREARMYVAQMRKAMDATIVELKEKYGVASRAEQEEVLRQARETLNGYREEVANELENISDETKAVAHGRKRRATQPIRKGDVVYHEQYRKEGTVLSDPDSSERVQVQMGPMKIWVPLSSLSRAEGGSKYEHKPKVHAAVSSTAPKRVPLELDIRGKTVEEAQIEVDKYLDDAMLTGRNEVGVIHGKGTGALREGVRTYLDNHPLVKSHRLGIAGEGGSGITIVTLKK